MQIEFGTDIEVSYSLKKRTEKFSSGCKQIRLNSGVSKWYKSVKNMGYGDMLRLLGFERNYSLILANAFDSALLRHHYLSLTRQAMGIRLQSRLASVCNGQVVSEEVLIELVLSLFFLHLDIPLVLSRALSVEARCLVVVIILRMCLEVQGFAKYLATVPREMFRSEGLFDVPFCLDFTSDQNREFYFGILYFRQILKNFDQLTKISKDEAKINCHDLFGLFDITRAHRDCEPMSKLVSSIDLNGAQQFLIFIKTRIKTNSKKFYKSKLRKIYYYPAHSSSKKNCFLVTARDFNVDYLGQLTGRSTRPLRRLRRHQAICIYMGPRIKKFLLSKLSESKHLEYDERRAFIISNKHVSGQTSACDAKSNGQSLDQRKLSRMFNKKMDSSYKISVNLFRILMCTDEYAFFSEEFLRKQFLRNELDDFLSHKVVLGRNCQIGSELVAKILFKSGSFKLPWTMIDRLNAIPYISNLEPQINARYLQS